MKLAPCCYYCATVLGYFVFISVFAAVKQTYNALNKKEETSHIFNKSSH